MCLLKAKKKKRIGETNKEECFGNLECIWKYCELSRIEAGMWGFWLLGCLIPLLVPPWELHSSDSPILWKMLAWMSPTPQKIEDHVSYLKYLVLIIISVPCCLPARQVVSSCHGLFPKVLVTYGLFSSELLFQLGIL